MNCDRIAHLYRWLEYAAFGRALEHHRFRYLPQVLNCRRALLLGDGDGRFTCELASKSPQVEIECVDSSLQMTKLNQRRLANSLGQDAVARVHLHQVDALMLTFPTDAFDLIATHFFFDCFSQQQTAELVQRVRHACREKTFWIVSEFCQPTTGWRAWHAKLWLRVMYAFFRLLTGLTTHRLPNHHSALQQAGFCLMARNTTRAGLIASELWKLK